MLEVDEACHFENPYEMLLSALNHLKTKGKADFPLSVQKSTENSKLVISNERSKQKLVFGSQFLPMLQARDQVLEHDFKIEINLEGYGSGKEEIDFTGSKEYDSLLKEIKKFLREAVSNIVSIAFKNLNEGKLDDKQAMEYAAKNIMLNIQSIFRQTVRTIEGHSLISPSLESQKLRARLISEIEQILNNILINLADNYPQAPASGGTPRMKEVINEINHVDNEQNDLIFSNNLCISKHIKLITGVSRDNQLTQKVDFQNQDYTEFIMEVINAAIQASQKNEEDSRERTVKEIFAQFNEKLFCLSKNKMYHSTINEIDKKSLEVHQRNEQMEGINKEKAKEEIFKYFNLTLERDREALEKHAESNTEQILDESEVCLEELRKEKKHLIGQKIPHFVKVFSRQDINNKNFTAQHSSILRILTKWAEYLQQIFKNAEPHIKQRLYPYKNIKNELVFIKEEEEKKRLISQLNQQYKEVKAKFFQIFNNNSAFIAQFLMAEQEDFVSNVCRYTETRIASSKINAVLTSLMLKYTSILIHHLLKAGREILTSKREQNINLIVFRVSDILRAKFQCSENSFISLLKTVYLLDSNESMRKKFKLVRIKNKLDDPANNIIINFLFMSKVQCELQMSIQEPKGKQKNYYAFSHFVYELTRGIFGPIAECAIMTSQLDPMIAASKGNYYEEKHKKRELQEVSLEQKCRTVKSEEDPSEVEDRLNEFEHQLVTQDADKRKQIFQCLLCRRLIIHESHQIFINKGNQSLCNQCVIETKEPEEELWNYEMKKVISEGIEGKFLQRLKGLSSLKQADNQCVLSLSANGELNLNVIIEIEKELKIFLVKLDLKLLNEIDSKKFDFSTIDYFNITGSLKNHFKKDSMNFELLYLVPYGPGSLSNEVFGLMNLKRELVENKLNIVVNAFKGFREEKNIIKTIKFKAEIININQDSAKFKTLGKIVERLVLRENNSDKDMEAFKYKRYRHLDISNLKEIQVQGIQLKQVPLWLKKCCNFHNIAFQNNLIDSVKEDELPLSTTELFLRQNKITAVNLSKLVNLVRLDIDNNSLADIDLSCLENLTKISLNNNKLTSINLSKLVNLSMISINNNQLKDININNLTNLREIFLNNNRLEEIGLFNLVNLTKLSLNSNKISSIDLSHLTSLTTLNLLNNRLKTIDLSSLVNITHVVLNKNRLTEVNLTNLTSLCSLCLQDNLLSHLDLSDLSSLTRLDLGSNELQSIDVSSLTSLTMLGLDKNRLQMIDLSCLSSLTNLDLDNNQLLSIDLLSLTSLSELYLSNNRLERIDLQNLNNLYILSLNGNPFKGMDLRNLSNLKQLHIDRKEIIDFDFGGMTSLQKLFIYNGFITEEQLTNLDPNVQIEIIEPEEEQC